MNGVYHRKALKSSEEHFKSFEKDTKKNEIFTVVNMILVAFTGVANNIATFSGTANVIVNTFLSVVLYFSLVITGIQKYYDYSQSAEKHRLISILYRTLSENIDDKVIPVQYIRSQYQLLRALGPGLADIEEFVNSISVGDENLENERDHELDFELQRMNNILV